VWVVAQEGRAPHCDCGS